MPVIYEIDKTKNLIRTRCPGDVTCEEGMEHLRALVQDPGRPATPNVLLDLCETTSVPDSDDLRMLADEVKRLAGVLRLNACAIVVANDHIFGMSRMFLVFAKEGFRATHVFRTFTNAEKWLESFRTPAPAG